MMNAELNPQGYNLPIRIRSSFIIHNSSLSCHPADESFQVIPLRKVERHRMIGAGAEPIDDLRVRASVERGTGDDLLKEIG